MNVHGNTKKGLVSNNNFDVEIDSRFEFLKEKLDVYNLFLNLTHYQLC